MRVALAFPGCHRRGGVERILVECANFLNGRGHECHVYASQWEEGVLAQGIVRHSVSCPIRPGPLRLPLFASRSRRQILQQQPAFDVCAGFGVLSPPGSVVWVQSVHQAWLAISQRQRSFTGRLKQKGNLAHPVILAMERDYFGGRKYKKLIALTEQVKIDIMQHYHVPAADIALLPNGYAPAEFNVERCHGLRAAMRQQLGYADNAKVVIFVANELERKGFGPLIRAAAALLDERVHLLVAGRVKPDSYAAELRRLNLSHRVQFVGSSNDVARYYAAADVFALPTQYEAWGLVIVEALACGLPVLTSRLAGASVAVGEGQTGVLIDNPNSVPEIAAGLQRLLNTKHVSAQDTSHSVEAYSWPQVLRRYEDILRECTS